VRTAWHHGIITCMVTWVYVGLVVVEVLAVMRCWCHHSRRLPFVCDEFGCTESSAGGHLGGTGTVRSLGYRLGLVADFARELVLQP